MNHTLVIAEAGVNHNGDMDLAFRLIEAAASAGADVVKFQTFRAQDLATDQADKADYQYRNTGKSESQLAMLQNLELTPQQHGQLVDHCEANGIEFLSTAFDFASIDLLASLNPQRWKIPSGEITNLPYLRKVGSLKQPVILSTGMSNLGEIEAAINVLEQAGTTRDQVTVLHCTTEYPAPVDEVNLHAMQSMATAFRVAVGYSDHTNGIVVPIAATALGAIVIEKHLTLDKNMPGPDHRASLEPDQFSSMVCGIRTVQSALGDGLKRPTKGEAKNIKYARKSLVANEVIKPGDTFTNQNMTAKRPGYGISPMLWDEYIDRKSRKFYQIDELIDE